MKELLYSVFLLMLTGCTQQQTLKTTPVLDKVTIKPVIEEVHHAGYSVVQDSIEVRVSQGSLNMFNFVCEAGSTITIKAPENIKGIVFSGHQEDIWQATVSSGNLAVLDKAHAESTTMAVLKDADSKMLTLTCATDILINSMDIFFDENPDVELGLDLVTYNSDVEIEEGVLSHYVINRVEWRDYGANYGRDNITNICLYSDEQNAMFDILVFAPCDTITGVKPGNYRFDTTSNQGTAAASFGYSAQIGWPAMSFGVANSNSKPEQIDWKLAAYLFITGGTITVEKIPEGVRMELDITTIKGKHVTAAYSGTPK